MRDLEYFNKTLVGGGVEIAEQMSSIETVSWLLTVSHGREECWYITLESNTR